jgi:hypothetical protein
MAYEALEAAILKYDDAQLAYQLQTWLNEKKAEEENNIPEKNPPMYKDALIRVAMLQEEAAKRGTIQTVSSSGSLGSGGSGSTGSETPTTSKKWLWWILAALTLGG